MLALAQACRRPGVAQVPSGVCDWATSMSSRCRRLLHRTRRLLRRRRPDHPSRDPRPRRTIAAADRVLPGPFRRTPRADRRRGRAGARRDVRRRPAARRACRRRCGGRRPRSRGVQPSAPGPLRLAHRPPRTTRLPVRQAGGRGRRLAVLRRGRGGVHAPLDPCRSVDVAEAGRVESAGRGHRARCRA